MRCLRKTVNALSARPTHEKETRDSESVQPRHVPVRDTHGPQSRALVNTAVSSIA